MTERTDPQREEHWEERIPPTGADVKRLKNLENLTNHGGTDPKKPLL